MTNVHGTLFWDPQFRIPRRPLVTDRVYHFNVIYNHARCSVSRTEDTKLALRVTAALVERLEARGYVNNYFYDRDHRPGNSFTTELARVLAGSSVTILLLTPGFIHKCLDRYLKIGAFSRLIAHHRPNWQLITLCIGVSREDVPVQLSSCHLFFFHEDWEIDIPTWSRFDNVIAHTLYGSRAEKTRTDYRNEKTNNCGRSTLKGTKVNTNYQLEDAEKQSNSRRSQKVNLASGAIDNILEEKCEDFASKKACFRDRLWENMAFTSMENDHKPKRFANFDKPTEDIFNNSSLGCPPNENEFVNNSDSTRCSLAYNQQKGPFNRHSFSTLNSKFGERPERDIESKRFYNYESCKLLTSSVQEHFIPSDRVAFIDYKTVRRIHSNTSTTSDFNKIRFLSQAGKLDTIYKQGERIPNKKFHNSFNEQSVADTALTNGQQTHRYVKCPGIHCSWTPHRVEKKKTLRNSRSEQFDRISCQRLAGVKEDNWTSGFANCNYKLENALEGLLVKGNTDETPPENLHINSCVICKEKWQSFPDHSHFSVGLHAQDKMEQKLYGNCSKNSTEMTLGENEEWIYVNADAFSSRNVLKEILENYERQMTDKSETWTVDDPDDSIVDNLARRTAANLQSWETKDFGKKEQNDPRLCSADLTHTTYIKWTTNQMLTTDKNWSVDTERKWRQDDTDQYGLVELPLWEVKTDQRIENINKIMQDTRDIKTIFIKNTTKMPDTSSITESAKFNNNFQPTATDLNTKVFISETNVSNTPNNIFTNVPTEEEQNSVITSEKVSLADSFDERSSPDAKSINKTFSFSDQESESGSEMCQQNLSSCDKFGNFSYSFKGTNNLIDNKSLGMPEGQITVTIPGNEWDETRSISGTHNSAKEPEPLIEGLQNCSIKTPVTHSLGQDTKGIKLATGKNKDHDTKGIELVTDNNKDYDTKGIELAIDSNKDTDSVSIQDQVANIQTNVGEQVVDCLTSLNSEINVEAYSMVQETINDAHNRKENMLSSITNEQSITFEQPPTPQLICVSKQLDVKRFTFYGDWKPTLKRSEHQRRTMISEAIPAAIQMTTDTGNFIAEKIFTGERKSTSEQFKPNVVQTFVDEDTSRPNQTFVPENTSSSVQTYVAENTSNIQEAYSPKGTSNIDHTFVPKDVSNIDHTFVSKETLNIYHTFVLEDTSKIEEIFATDELFAVHQTKTTEQIALNETSTIGQLYKAKNMKHMEATSDAHKTPKAEDLSKVELNKSIIAEVLCTEDNGDNSVTELKHDCQTPEEIVRKVKAKLTDDFVEYPEKDNPTSWTIDYIDSVTMDNKMDIVTVDNNMDIVTINNNMDVVTIKNNMDIVTINNNMDNVAADNNMDIVTMDDNMDIVTDREQGSKENGYFIDKKESGYIEDNKMSDYTEDEQKWRYLGEKIESIFFREKQESGHLEEKQESGYLEMEQEHGCFRQTDSIYFGEETESGNFRKKKLSGHLEEKHESGYLEQKQESGHLEEKQESGHLEEKHEIVYLEEKQESVYLEEKQESGHLEEKQESGYLEEKQESGHLEEKQESGYLEEKHESAYLEEKQESGHLEEKQESGYLEEKQESEYLEEKQESIYLEEKQESEHLEEKQKSEHLEDKQESGYLEEKHESVYLEEKQESGHLEEKQESGHLEEKHESVYLEEKQESVYLEEKQEIGCFGDNTEDGHFEPRNESGYSENGEIILAKTEKTRLNKFHNEIFQKIEPSIMSQSTSMSLNQQASESENKDFLMLNQRDEIWKNQTSFFVLSEPEKNFVMKNNKDLGDVGDSMLSGISSLLPTELFDTHAIGGDSFTSEDDHCAAEKPYSFTSETTESVQNIMATQTEEASTELVHHRMATQTDAMDALLQQMVASQTETIDEKSQETEQAAKNKTESNKKADWMLPMFRGVCHVMSHPEMPFLG